MVCTGSSCSNPIKRTIASIVINDKTIYNVPFDSKEEAISFQKENEIVVTENYEVFHLVKIKQFD